MPDCYGGNMSSNSDIPQKSYMGDISEGVADTLQPDKKNIQKIIIVIRKRCHKYSFDEVSRHTLESSQA